MAEVKTRPKLLHGVTIKAVCGCGAIYITINEHNNEVFEVFINHGKGGRCSNVMMGASGVIISHGLRAGVKLEEYMKALAGFRCDMTINAVQNKGIQVLSCIDAISKVFGEYLERNDPSKLEINKEINKMEQDKELSYTAIAPAPPRDSVTELQEIANELAVSTAVSPKIEPEQQIVGGSFCEICGGAVVRQEGCEKCVLCGHSQKCGGA